MAPSAGLSEINHTIAISGQVFKIKSKSNFQRNKLIIKKMSHTSFINFPGTDLIILPASRDQKEIIIALSIKQLHFLAKFIDPDLSFGLLWKTA